MSQKTNLQDFLRRANYQGNWQTVFPKICVDFGIGKYISHKPVLMGYEDLNIILKTQKGKFFVKIFGSFRTESDCQRYVKVMEKVTASKINHPKLYKSKQGYLYTLSTDKTIDRLSIMQFIDGKTFYHGNYNPNEEEAKFIISQTAKINKLRIKPVFVYDSWAINNFLKEYGEKHSFLSKNDLLLVEPVAKDFAKIKHKTLPHCFIHGDLTKTNILKDKEGNLWIIDFAVSNFLPRIQELAVLLCDLFFDKENPDKTQENQKFAIRQYQKYIKLTDAEIKNLPVYLKAAHAMHLLRSNFEKVANGTKSDENDYYYNIGKKGL